MILMNRKTITIGGRKYIVNTKKLGRNIFILFLFIMFISNQCYKLFSEDTITPSTSEVMATTLAPKMIPVYLKETSVNVSSDATSKKSPKMMSNQKFTNQASHLFPKVTTSYFDMIYIESLGNDLPPYFSLGIAWQESKFNEKVTGPKTRYGTARGLYQIIETTAKGLVDIEDPSDLYNAKIAIPAGNKVLGIYRDWLSGKVDNKTPGVFTHFTVKDNVVSYKGKVIRDQKGDAVPLLLMTAISYNGGPGVITAALNRDGVLVLDPNATNRNIPIQSLDYALQINKNLYNFEYDFAYTSEQIDRSKIF